MKTIIGTHLAKATLAVALAAGATSVYAQDTTAPPPESGAPMPADPTTPPPSTEPAPAPAPAPTDQVDEDGDGLDDVTGEPIEEDGGDTMPSEGDMSAPQ